MGQRRRRRRLWSGREGGRRWARREWKEEGCDVQVWGRGRAGEWDEDGGVVGVKGDRTGGLVEGEMVRILFFFFSTPPFSD